MTTVAAPTPSALAVAPRPRRTAWPYAGIVSAAAAGVPGSLLVQGPGTFPSTDVLDASLSSALSLTVGAGIALLGLVATFVFLFGLTRFVARHAPLRAGLVEALRWASIAFLATGSIGVVVRCAPGGTAREAATLSVLADQLSTAANLPALAVMALVGVAAVRDRVLARAVGVLALLLTALSVGTMLVVGLPHSASLVYPVFALVVGVAALVSRKPA
jgi:hypothetical protein